MNSTKIPIIAAIVITIAAIAAYVYIETAQQPNLSPSQSTTTTPNSSDTPTPNPPSPTTQEEPDVYITQLIKGPIRGETGNQADQSFRSLTVSWTNPETVYIGSEGNGIFMSVDGGNTWKWLRKGLKYPLGEGSAKWYAEVYDMAIDPLDENIIYACTTNGPYPDREDSPGQWAGVYKSTDGGESWQQKNHGLPVTSVNSLLIDPGSNTVYAGVCHSIPPIEDGPGLVNLATGLSGGIYRSTDGAMTWEALPVPEKALHNALNIMLMSQNTFFVSGIIYENLPEGGSRISKDKSLGLIKSVDGGQTWENITPPGTVILYFDVSPSNADIIYAYAYGDYELYKSLDGGKTWFKPGAPINGLVKVSPADPETVLIDDGWLILRSEDGGKSCSPVIEVSMWVNDIEFAPSDPDVVYISTAGLILYRSSDGGRTFTQVADLRQFIDSHP